MRRTSFGAIVLSVSRKLVVLEGLLLLPRVPPYSGNAPSDAVDKSLLTFERTPPHAQVMLPTRTRPLLSVVYAPRALPLVGYSKRRAEPLLGSFTFAITARPIESLLHTMPWPVAAASTDTLLSSSEFAFVFSRVTDVLSVWPVWSALVFLTRRSA